MPLKVPLVRSLDAGARLQTFLVAATVSVLAIRLGLDLVGYPRLGGARFHIAHVLWGGILMLVAIGILLSFLGKGAERVAAVIGGVGFGAFLDEIGKFVTSDNDYFFRPAVALIYIVLVLVFLAGRAIRGRRTYSDTEYLVNAVVEIEEAAAHDLDEEEKRRALAYLTRSDPSHPLVEALTQALERTELVPVHRPSWPERAVRRIRDGYRRLAMHPRFTPIVVSVFVTELLLKFLYLGVVVLVARADWAALDPARGPRSIGRETLAVVEWAKVGSWLLSAYFVTRGVLTIRRSRLEAFRDFERSVLVSLFITHVFNFYTDEFRALMGVALSILLLVTIRYMIERERSEAATREAGSLARNPLQAGPPGPARRDETSASL